MCQKLEIGTPLASDGGFGGHLGAGLKTNLGGIGSPGTARA